MLAVANTGFLCGPAEYDRSPCSSLETTEAGSRVEVPAEYEQAPKHVLLFFGVGVLKLSI